MFGSNWVLSQEMFFNVHRTNKNIRFSIDTLLL